MFSSLIKSDMQLKADHIMDVCSSMPSWMCLLQAMFLQSHQKENTPLDCPHSSSAWTSTALPCAEQGRSTRACSLYYLWEVSIMHIHEHPLHLHSPRNPFTNTKGWSRIGNQGKPGSLKWTRHCSMNWQQKIARQSENLKNRNIEKYFEWKPTNLRQVWDVPGDNSSACLSWLCTVS